MLSMNAPETSAGSVSDVPIEQKPVVQKVVVRANSFQLALLKAAFDKAESISGANLKALSDETKLSKKWIANWFGRQRVKLRTMKTRVIEGGQDPAPDSALGPQNTPPTSEQIMTMKEEIQESSLGAATSTASTTNKTASTKPRTRKPRKKKESVTSVSAIAPIAAKMEEHAISLRYTPDGGRKPPSAFRAPTMIPNLGGQDVRKESVAETPTEATSSSTAYTHSPQSSISSGTPGSTLFSVGSFAAMPLNYRYVEFPKKTIEDHYDITGWNDYLTTSFPASDSDSYEQYKPDAPAPSFVSSSQSGPISSSPPYDSAPAASFSVPTSVQASNSLTMTSSYSSLPAADLNPHRLDHNDFGAGVAYYRQDNLPAPSSYNLFRNYGQADFRDGLDDGIGREPATNLHMPSHGPVKVLAWSPDFGTTTRYLNLRSGVKLATGPSGRQDTANAAATPMPTLTSVFPTFLDPDHAPLKYVKHLVNPFLTEHEGYRELLELVGERRERVLKSLLNKDVDPFTSSMGLLLATKLRLTWSEKDT